VLSSESPFFSGSIPGKRGGLKTSFFQSDVSPNYSQFNSPLLKTSFFQSDVSPLLTPSKSASSSGGSVFNKNICVLIETTSPRGGLALCSLPPENIQMINVQEWAGSSHSAFITQAFEALFTLEQMPVSGMADSPVSRKMARGKEKAVRELLFQSGLSVLAASPAHSTPASSASPAHSTSASSASSASPAHSTLSKKNFIAIGVGPGRFTGVRVGVSFAKTLGFALNIPIYPVSSLKILAESQTGQEKPILVLLNAFTKSLYMALYQKRKGGLEELAPPCVVSVQLMEKQALPECVCVGDGYAVYKDKLSSNLKKRMEVKENVYPEVKYLAALLKREFDPSRLISWRELTPVYLRSPVQTLV